MGTSSQSDMCITGEDSQATGHLGCASLDDELLYDELLYDDGSATDDDVFSTFT